MQYLHTSADSVIEALTERLAASLVNPDFLRALLSLLPFEEPWSRILVAPCGEWAALVNNGLHGGDGTAPGPALSRALDVECVVASNVPRYGPGHEQTQLEVYGPDGDPPLMYVRSISVTATDGRWEWHESGAPFEFEQRHRYAARHTRDRFDRELLLDYLVSLGIPARDDTAYGPATLLQDPNMFDRRRMTLAQARAEFR